MPNQHDDFDNVQNIKDFKRKPKRQLNGASAYQPQAKKSGSRWGKKIGTAVQFVLVIILAVYFMQTCDSMFPGP